MGGSRAIGPSLIQPLTFLVNFPGGVVRRMDAAGETPFGMVSVAVEAKIYNCCKVWP